MEEFSSEHNSRQYDSDTAEKSLRLQNKNNLNIKSNRKM